MRSERKDDFDRCELVLDCLLLIANVRRYWISVDVTKNINTEEEIPNYSCIDLDVWMGLFSTILTTDIPLFCTLSLSAPSSLAASTPSCTVFENLKASVINFCTTFSPFPLLMVAA